MSAENRCKRQVVDGRVPGAKRQRAMLARQARLASRQKHFDVLVEWARQRLFHDVADTQPPL